MVEWEGKYELYLSRQGYSKDKSKTQCEIGNNLHPPIYATR